MSITVYGKQNCKQCEFTKKFLDSKHASFVYEDLTDNIFSNALTEAFLHSHFIHNRCCQQLREVNVAFNRQVIGPFWYRQCFLDEFCGI